MKNLKLWICRTFEIITTVQAKEMGLTHLMNIYGDQINQLNCRSIWVDVKFREYRVKELNV